MASHTLSSGLEMLQQTVNGGAQSAKVQDMARNTRDVHDPNAKLTTDYGVKHSNTGMLSAKILHNQQQWC